MVGDEVMGRIIERVRSRNNVYWLNRLAREHYEFQEQKRKRDAEVIAIAKKRYQEMLADPRYENVWMHPVTGVIFYNESPEQRQRSWWEFWK